MARRPPGSGSCSYTVVVIPLRTSLHSLDALRFYLWIKRLKDLEKEKDALYSGLEVLEKARFWYLQQLEENRAQQDMMDSNSGITSDQRNLWETRSCLLRTHIQRASGSLGSVMSESRLSASSSDLRWHNAALTQEVSKKNRRITMLEYEKDALLQELHQL